MTIHSKTCRRLRAEGKSDKCVCGVDAGQSRQRLIKTLSDNGLTVLLSKDHTAMLLELTMLKRFDRLVRKAAAVDGQLSVLVKDIDRGADALRTSLPQSA